MLVYSWEINFTQYRHTHTYSTTTNTNTIDATTTTTTSTTVIIIIVFLFTWWDLDRGGGRGGLLISPSVRHSASGGVFFSLNSYT